MSKGEIIEEGTHDKLLDSQGYYAQLHSYQNHTPTKSNVKNSTVRQSGPTGTPLFTIKTVPSSDGSSE
jgi:hypothetical protein